MTQDELKMITEAKSLGIDPLDFQDDQGELDIDGLMKKVREERGPEWIHFTEKGNPLAHSENTAILLDFYHVKVRYNQMVKDLDIEIPGKTFHGDTEMNAKLVVLHDLAREQGYATQSLDQHLIKIGNENSYHPVKDWILSQTWDGTDRFGELLKTIEYDPEQSKMIEILLRRWLYSCVAALFLKGFRAQGVLTLVGPQGVRKTRWLMSLVPNPGWCRDGVVLDPRNKDSVLQCSNRWIVELGEVDATFRKADIAALKAFITSPEDTLRQAYAKKADKYQRMTSFCASVNDTDYLVDSENRRFWTVEVTGLNPEHDIDLQQLWAQMYQQWWNGGEVQPHWLTAGEHERLTYHNKYYETIDPIIEKFDEMFELPNEHNEDRTDRLGVSAILDEFKIRYSKRETNRLAGYMRASGFQQRRDTKKFKVAYKERTWKIVQFRQDGLEGV